MYQNMFKVAQEIALQRMNTGQCTPNDTVCVISAASKQVYTGVNHAEMQNGMMINIHAEIDAVQQMRAGGDTIAEYILLIGAMSLQPILPCNNCMNFILAQAPENANCQVVLPDRMIPLPQIGQFGGSNSVPFNSAMPAGGSMYGNMPYGMPQGSMYGAPQGSMYGAPPQGSMYGAPPQGSMYGQGSMYNNGSMPYNGANPAGGSMYTSSMYGNPQGGGHYAGGPIKPKKSGGSMLKGKVGGLLNAGKDIGNDEPEESEFMKKLFKK